MNFDELREALVDFHARLEHDLGVARSRPSPSPIPVAPDRRNTVP